MDMAVVEKKAAQLLHRGVALLLNALTFGLKLSHWRFETSESVSGGVSVFKALGVSGSGGNIYLFYDPSKDRSGKWETSTIRSHLEYVVGGVSVGVPIPFDPVSASYSAASWPNTGWLLTFPGHGEFEADPQCFNDPTIRSAPVMLIQIDAALLPLRWMLSGMAGVGAITSALPKSDVLDRQFAGSAALMFLGVNPILQALLKSLAGNFRALANAVTRRAPTGIWASIGDTVTRPYEIGWDLAKVEAEMMVLIPTIQALVGQSRGVLATVGVEAALPGAGIAAYFGLIKSWADESKVGADGHVEEPPDRMRGAVGSVLGATVGTAVGGPLGGAVGGTVGVAPPKPYTF
jgi:hypothetical protein